MAFIIRIYHNARSSECQIASIYRLHVSALLCHTHSSSVSVASKIGGVPLAKCLFQVSLVYLQIFQQFRSLIWIHSVM